MCNQNRTASTKRKSIGKGQRFNIFRRDGFTCRYCGAQPPEVVLEIDHVVPVSAGGGNDDDNLVTACWRCNHGKSAKSLTADPPIDTDLKWLEMQQEIAELRRFQEAKTQRDAAMLDVLESLKDRWQELTGLDWAPSDDLLRAAIERAGPSIVEDALSITGRKIRQRKVSSYGSAWAKYFHGVLRSMIDQQGGG